MSPRYVRPRTALAPVLGEPRASAAQESQILYGHLAQVVSEKGGWLRLRSADGYEGWVHEGYLVSHEESVHEAWGWAADAEVSLGCSVRDPAGFTMDLPLGAVVRSGRCVAGRSLDLTRRREVFPPDPDAIVASARGLFQGTYYQWGGITPWGADCSGMVQSVFALHGIRLLRDAWQQATQGAHVDGGLDALQPADLLFFSDREDGHITHVALAASSSRIVHLALGRGGHSLESLAHPDDYATALLERFRFARRIIGQGTD